MPDAPPRVRDLLARGAARLRTAGIETPDLDAGVLLGHLLGVNRASLYAHALDVVPPTVMEAYDAAIARRVTHEPVAYLTGTKEFMGLTFAVSDVVLVPRPETELLVEWAIAWLGARKEPATVIDVGTGSGAIAVSVAHLAPSLAVLASDISIQSLHIARSNARRHNSGERIGFVCGDLLCWLGKPVHLILANLPYLTDSQADALELAAEPRSALAGGDSDGFVLYRALIPQAASRLVTGGACAFEIDPSQAAIARAACQAAFPNARIAVHDDLAGLARFVTVETDEGGCILP